MDKDFILHAIKARLEELGKKYREYCDIDNGPSKSASGSACMRARVKKDIDTLRLVEYLVMWCPDSFEITDKDMSDIMDRFLEPRRLKK